MAKKDKARQCQNLEEFQRMNFLYQAAALLTATTISNNNNSSQSTKHTVPKRKTPKSKPRSSRPPSNITDPTRPPLAGLGRFYISTLKSVARRNVLRL
jgi:hypothetical protein